MTSALVRVADKSGNQIICKALLDTCSTTNFITDRLTKRLRLPKTRCSLTIGAMNDLSTTANYFTKVSFKSLNSEFQKSLIFFVVPVIAESVPNETFARETFNIPKNIKLADPEFYKPSNVDLLIASGPTLSMLCSGQIKLDEHEELILHKTRLGWIIGGHLNFNKINKKSHCMVTDLNFDLEKFWNVEEITPVRSLKSHEDSLCEQNFKDHVTRDKDGRYVVALPFQEDFDLGESRSIALKRFLSLKRKFDANAEFAKQYETGIQEYINTSHMTLIDKKDERCTGFYIPHLPVIKESSNTTKFRIVFDASAKSQNGCSLNDCLLTGPTIQDDLFTILLRFRKHTYVLIGDLEKMFRQFWVREEDRKFLKTLWPLNGEIREWTLNTITFGLKPAPFLAVRCIHQLADDEKHRFPLAAKILKSDMYVDNMLTGTDSKKEAREICRQMNVLLETAGLKMRQWASNDKTLLKGIAEQDLDVNFDLDKDNSLKTLGIYWKAKNDEFIYEIRKIKLDEKVTKRRILSDIAKIFDPLGLLGPIILFAKKIMQDIWQTKTEWDESVTGQIQYAWNKFCTQLNSIENITFDRQVISQNSERVELHGFCDASQDGYGACIYLRSMNHEGECSIVLLCSKSRVAPLKKKTTPRLELCAIQLLSHLHHQVMNAMNLNIDDTYFWSDSTIALNWIKTQPNLLQVYVANRVADVQANSNPKNWHYVRSAENPADALSRGQLPLDFLKNKKWLTGPSWLKLKKESWPESELPAIKNLPEKRKAHCFFVNVYKQHIRQIFNNFSSFLRLTRVIAICLRWCKKYRKKGPIEASELIRAENIVIISVQESTYNNEIRSLAKNESLSDKNKLASLDPFLDENGLLRVGGRIRKALISYSTRHPIILPRNSNVTKLLIRRYHILNHHSGVQNTLCAMRDKFWPINGRCQIRGFIRKCILCFRAKPHLVDYKMGNLPSTRIRESRVFNHVGVDYCGPFYIKEKRYRNKAFVKCYVSIFVCMSTKAIHIEIVEDMSTDAFLGALRRFVARRGIPQTINSDNGTNFQGANNELSELYELLNANTLKDKLYEFVNVNKIEWRFIPPSAPNFGGLWEAAVKQFKHHFKRVAFDKRFTFVEFSTFACEVEAILNSRPLTPVSDDPHDYIALTPGHFLIGDSMKSMPEHEYKTIPTNRLNSWQNISKIKQSFWTRWHKEYLTSLNVRANKKGNDSGLKVGMMVLLKDDNLPTMEWHIGRIAEIETAPDGITRTVVVNTKTGKKKRPASKIAILPIDDNEKCID